MECALPPPLRRAQAAAGRLSAVGGPLESGQHPCNALGWETAVGLEAAVSEAVLHVAPAPGAAQLLTVNWSKG